MNAGFCLYNSSRMLIKNVITEFNAGIAFDRRHNNATSVVYRPPLSPQ